MTPDNNSVSHAEVFYFVWRKLKPQKHLAENDLFPVLLDLQPTSLEANTTLI